MLIRSVALTLLGLGTAVTLGCSGGRYSFHYYDDDPPPARVVHVHKHRVPAHTHTVHVCGRDHGDCYWDGERVVVIRGHRHGPGCGHAWDGKHWIIVKKAPPKVRRIHAPPPRSVRIRRLP
jgi:hypothetical protein